LIYPSDKFLDTIDVLVAKAMMPQVVWSMVYYLIQQVTSLILCVSPVWQARCMQIPSIPHPLVAPSL
jgi:hypothetical protein